MTPAETVETLLARHGQTFAEELDLELASNAPQALFGWLCTCLLLSARISSTIAMRAAAGLRAHGWTPPAALAKSTRDARVAALDAAGYGRYDEKTATYLGDLAERLLRDYGGDLTALRARADRDPARERALVTAFKGIGDVGADIFFREMQGVWDEHYPFLDARTAKAARGFGLPATADGLAALVDPSAFPRLLAALLRAERAGDPHASRPPP